MLGWGRATKISAAHFMFLIVLHFFISIFFFFEKKFGTKVRGEDGVLKRKQGMAGRSINRRVSEMNKQINKYQSRKGSVAL